MQERLKKYFQQVYQGQESFIDNVISPIFGEECFENGYNQNVLKDHPVLLPTAQATGIDSIIYIGKIDIPFNSISVFDITVSSHILLSRNRVGIQQIIRRIIETYTSAFMIFHYQDNSCCDWRFTFCSKEKNNEITDNKRYTFILGPNQSCRTVTENFSKLYSKEKNIEIEDIKEAFNVEALSNEFFSKYKQHYEKFVMYITGKCFIKSSGKWKEKVEHEPNPQMYASFGKDDKQVRDYVKKLLGRIVFLHFLQKKGWLGVPQDKQWGEGDYQFMFHLFDKATKKQKDDFLDSVLEPLFNDLNTKRDNDLVSNCNVGLNIKVPYLNGGLFERDKLDEIKTHFPKEFFEDLFDFLSQYNFTIDENDPNDAEVGIDPEMLGRIFENLLEDNKDKGAFYTPKEIVQYMCRESLIAYLQTDTKDDNTKEQIRNFVTTYNIDYLSEKLRKTIDTKLRNVKICDPAIGSGAFPMGLLKELFFCRGAIENFDDSANIKRHIIQNNIYGVDIEKGAVDIARLRFWLSLVVDEQTPNTLPNLDFKIMQGNSLLEQYKGVDLSKLTQKKIERKEGTQMTLFENSIDVLREELRNMLNEYYSLDDHTEKQKLLHRIRENINKQQNENGIQVNLSDINIQSNDQFFLWHTWFNDVFEQGGFDIVIGNPPYISAPAQIANEQLAEQRERLKACKRYQTLHQKWDLYVPFMEKGLKMLCKNGAFAMIVPFPLSNQLYGMKFRKWVTENYNVQEISDLNGTKVFDNATVSNLILFVKNNGKTNETNISHINEHLEFSSDFIQPISALIQDEIKFVWNFSQESRDANAHADMNVLGDFCYVSKGMVLNADEKTAKGEFSKEDLISKTKDNLHPREYIEAKDIEKYHVNRVRYLEYNTPRCPDKLSRPTFRELYEVDKIVMNCLGTINGTIDNDKHYLHNHSIYCAILWRDLNGVNNKSISASIKRYSKHSRQEMEQLSNSVCLEYLLAILNSQYAETLLANLRGDDYHIYPEHIRNIPIPQATREQQNQIKEIVENVIEMKQNNKDVSDLLARLDKIIYNLYNK